LKERKEYRLKGIRFTTPVRHIHPVETYGTIFHLNKTIALISDTRYFDGLPDFYRADYLIVNVLRVDPIEKQEIVEHLAVDDFVRIVEQVKPEMAIMTHFGMSMVKENPDLVAEKLSKETGINVVAAYDGMRFDF
jgi:phosphoribosyl 1,2-cyclic phosphodiesterase